MVPPIRRGLASTLQKRVKWQAVNSDPAFFWSASGETPPRPRTAWTATMQRPIEEPNVVDIQPSEYSVRDR
jgi:hypothetical protein